jgi:PAS domain S-box-containing protein
VDAGVLRTAIEQAAEAVLVTDPAGRIEYANAAAVELTGYSREELLGQNPRLLKSGFHDVAFYNDLWNTISRGRVWKGDIVNRRKDGGLNIERTTIAPVLGHGGRIVRFIAIKQNVTELSKKEEALERTQYSIDHAGDSVLWTDRQGSIIYANETSFRSLGYPREELLALSVFEINPDLDRTTWPALWERAKSEGSSIERAVRRRRDGSTFPVELSITHVAFRGQEYLCLVGHDITAQVTAEAALRSAERRYHSLFEGMSQGFAYCRILAPGEGGRDFEFLEVNPAFEAITGLHDVAGKKASEIFPGLRGSNPEVIESYGRVAATGQSERLVTHLRALDLWLDVSVYSFEKGRFVTLFEDISARKRAESTLRASEQRYRTLFERNLAGVYRASLDGRILECNNAFARIFGYPSREDLSDGPASSSYRSPATTEDFINRLRAQGSVLNYESQGTQKDGKTVYYLENATLVDGEVIEGTVVDLTNQKELEGRFLQAQKMEVVGRLAGGVAHDFNNLLGVINGYGELVLRRMATNDPQREKVVQILRAGERAAGLTRQLLAFSRQQLLQPKVLDLNEVVSDMKKMLHRLIGEDIELATVLDPTLDNIKADPGQLEQAIMNLAINARDAMPDGGLLTIETKNVELDQSHAATHPTMVPGSYVQLAVSDTGTGMDERTRSHIFEPFFTTKGTGKGTGLGLSTVYGIVKQSGGFIWVYSEQGVGTTFKIYLPRIGEAVERTVEEPVRPTGGNETVLLVEDEVSLRDLLRESLESQGYSTLVAGNGAEAVEVARTRRPIHLLATDVIMPGMSGRAAADAIRQAHPGIRVLYMSGYTDEAIVRHSVLEPGVAFLSKPFSADRLLQEIRGLLDRS